MLTLLDHASECSVPNCQVPNCSRMKALLMHSPECTVRLTGGCVNCNRFWRLLSLHAKVGLKKRYRFGAWCGATGRETDPDEHLKFSAMPSTARNVQGFALRSSQAPSAPEAEQFGGPPHECRHECNVGRRGWFYFSFLVVYFKVCDC